MHVPLHPMEVVRCVRQVDAFKDYQPGEGAPAAASTEESAEAEDAPGVEGMESESGASAGDFPEHAVLGLPALSPTMSQGKPQLPSCSFLRLAVLSSGCGFGPA